MRPSTHSLQVVFFFLRLRHIRAVSRSIVPLPPPDIARANVLADRVHDLKYVHYFRKLAQKARCHTLFSPCGAHALLIFISPASFLLPTPNTQHYS